MVKMESVNACARPEVWCEHMCNRKMSLWKSINSSSKNLYMGVGVEIHILVIIFLLHKQMTLFSNIYPVSKKGRDRR